VLTLLSSDKIHLEQTVPNASSFLGDGEEMYLDVNNVDKAIAVSEDVLGEENTKIGTDAIVEVAETIKSREGE
jgi:hypothetical protein